MNRKPGIDAEWLRTTKDATLRRTTTAQVLKVDVRTVTRAIENGEIPAVKVGGRILIPTHKLRQLLGIEPAATAQRGDGSAA